MIDGWVKVNGVVDRSDELEAVSRDMRCKAMVRVVGLVVKPSQTDSLLTVILQDSSLQCL